MTVTDPDAVFPATSVACTATEIDPWTITTEQLKLPADTLACAPLHKTVARPDTASLTRPLTETLAEPLTLPSRGELMASRGGVWSRLTITLALAEPPTASVAVPLIS